MTTSITSMSSQRIRNAKTDIVVAMFLSTLRRLQQYKKPLPNMKRRLFSSATNAAHLSACEMEELKALRLESYRQQQLYGTKAMWALRLYLTSLTFFAMTLAMVRILWIEKGNANSWQKWLGTCAPGFFRVFDSSLLVPSPQSYCWKRGQILKLISLRERVLTTKLCNFIAYWTFSKFNQHRCLCGGNTLWISAPFTVQMGATNTIPRTQIHTSP